MTLDEWKTVTRALLSIGLGVAIEVAFLFTGVKAVSIHAAGTSDRSVPNFPKRKFLTYGVATADALFLYWKVSAYDIGPLLSI